MPLLTSLTPQTLNRGDFCVVLTHYMPPRAYGEGAHVGLSVVKFVERAPDGHIAFEVLWTMNVRVTGEYFSRPFLYRQPAHRLLLDETYIIGGRVMGAVAVKDEYEVRNLLTKSLTLLSKHCLLYHEKHSRLFTS